jgi:hypothetical protein
MLYYTGIDISLESSYIYLVDERGIVVMEATHVARAAGFEPKWQKGKTGDLGACRIT